MPKDPKANLKKVGAGEAYCRQPSPKALAVQPEAEQNQGGHKHSKNLEPDDQGGGGFCSRHQTEGSANKFPSKNPMA
jgi:hypothetical protein